MKRIASFLILAALIIAGKTTKADEGLWLLSQIQKMNYEEMQKMGLQLSADEIYSINHSSLKDGIVEFNSGCTGGMVSDQGLLLTAYHCGLDYIQYNSEVEDNFVEDGFWAKSKNEELACPGLTVSFMIRMEDVSQKVLSGINEKMTENMRKTKVQDAIQKIVENATKKTRYRAEVKSFFEGKEYYLFVYETFTDIRLVGAPPKNIGNFGGETDNWVWPRHTGDFSFFRIYTAPNGDPAKYAAENIPLQPKHYFPISLDGVKENDYAMSLGFPGSTNRYASSSVINLAQNERNPAIIKIRDAKLEIISRFMEQSNENYLKYLPKFNRVSNYWKYFKEQTLNLEYLDIHNKKIMGEKAFQNWANTNPERKEYLNALKEMQANYQTYQKYHLSKTYYNEVVRRGTELLTLAEKFMPLYDALQAHKKSKKKKQTAIGKEITEKLKEDIREYIRKTDFNTDKEIFAALFKLYYQNIDKEQHPDIFQVVERNHYNNMEVFANFVFNTSLFTDINKLWYFANHPDLGVLENDIAMKILLSCKKKQEEINNGLIETKNNLAKAKRTYLQGLKEMQPDKKFYPDGNSTLRLTYGKVSGYIPINGLIAEYRTTLDGVFEKNNIANTDYSVPKTIQLFHDYRDYDQYGEKNMLPTCFIINNDVSGGFSGAPVLNGKGELMGLVFDLNKEAISSEYIYTQNLHRTICLDIKYALFIIDKVYKADYLMNELKIKN